MLNISIKTIPDTSQRYNTVGDYQTNQDGSQEIRISNMSDQRYEFLVLLHELVESQLCKTRGISDEEIDAFDIAFEANRRSDDFHSEPGDMVDAPYHHEHVFASKIEKLMAEELGVDWHAYSEECANLTKKS